MSRMLRIGMAPVLGILLLLLVFDPGREAQARASLFLSDGCGFEPPGLDVVYECLVDIENHGSTGVTQAEIRVSVRELCSLNVCPSGPDQSLDFLDADPPWTSLNSATDDAAWTPLGTGTIAPGETVRLFVRLNVVQVIPAEDSHFLCVEFSGLPEGESDLQTLGGCTNIGRGFGGTGDPPPDRPDSLSEPRVLSGPVFTGALPDAGEGSAVSVNAPIGGLVFALTMASLAAALAFRLRRQHS